MKTVTDNLALKMFSVLFAVLLQIYFYSPDNSDRGTFSAVVEVRNLPKEVMMVRPAAADKGLYCRVTVRGPSPLVEALSGGTQVIFVDLPNPLPERYLLEFDSDSLKLPSGVQVLDMEPKTIELAFERVFKRELAVVVQTKGQPEPGYRLEDLRVYPSKVFARGPESDLVGVGSINTGLIDLGGLNKSFRQEVPLEEISPLTSLGLNLVTVEVDIAPIVASREFRSVPIQVVAGPGMAVRADSVRADAVLTGPELELKALDNQNVKLLADASALGAGEHEVRLTAKFEGGVMLDSASPESVTVRVVREGDE